MYNCICIVLQLDKVLSQLLHKSISGDLCTSKTSFKQLDTPFLLLCFYYLKLTLLIAVITEIKHLCPGNSMCLPTSSCIEVPPIDVGQTLVLVLPFLPAVGGLEEDILCPVHPLHSETCIDLLSCNRFRESAYANSITVCRTMDNSSSFEMCFQNITKKLNETKAHFFYSTLQCAPSLKSSRVYIKSLKVIVDSEFFMQCLLTDKMNALLTIDIKILIRDAYGCVIYENITHESNISYATMFMNAACAPYTLEVVTNGELTYMKEILGDFKKKYQMIHMLASNFSYLQDLVIITQVHCDLSVFAIMVHIIRVHKPLPLLFQCLLFFLHLLY